MTTHNVHAKEAAARAKFATAKRKPAAIVGETQQVIAVVRSNALIADPNLNQSVTQWETSTVAVDKSDQAIKTTKLSLAGLRAQRAKAVTVWKRATGSVLAAVDTVSAGSAQVITQLGFEIETRQAAPPSIAPPGGLHARYTKGLALVVKWKGVKGNRGYQLEIGDATGQTFGPPLISLKSTYEPQGLVPGQKVTLRVAVQRKDGLSGWSDPVAVVVR